MIHRYRVAVIPGDGIGHEVVPAAQRVLELAARRFEFELAWEHLDWSCDRYRHTGRMMPENGLDILRSYDAIFLGAVGDPAVPDHVSLWGLLLPIRRGFQQYVNLRPVRLLRGITSPLRDREAGSIDFCVVRENTEGEYSEIGERVNAGTGAEAVMQTAVFSRRGCDRDSRRSLRRGSRARLRADRRSLRRGVLRPRRTYR